MEYSIRLSTKKYRLVRNMTETTQSKTRGRPKTLDRQRTIELAMESYWREGLEACSVNEICRHTQISKPGLYREFGGEDGLMEAVLSHYQELVVVPLLAMLSAERPSAEVLRELIDWITEDHDTPSGCLFVKMRSAPTRLGSATTKRIETVRGEMRAAYKAWYQRGLERHEVKAGIDPDLAAYYIETQLVTVLNLMAAGEPPEQVRAQALLAFERVLVG